MLNKKIASQQGFSLLEIAIVLGITALVVAGIWLIMSTVNQNSREGRLASQAIETITNARRVFGNAAEQPDVSGTEAFTQAAITAGIFPADMVRGLTPHAVHALGSRAFLRRISGRPELDLSFNGLQQDTCIRLLTKTIASTGTQEKLGITDVLIDGANMGALDSVKVADIARGCSAAPVTKSGLIVSYYFSVY